MRYFVYAILYGLMAMLTGGVAQADPSPPNLQVDLELVLAVDISSSIDRDEAKLQRQGFVDALTSDVVLRAIQGGQYGRIAVAYLEYSGLRRQRLVAPWAVIEDENTAEDFADVIDDASLISDNWTSISSMLLRGRDMLESNAYQGTRRVIDVSGDGANNNGDPIVPIRDALVSEGIVINGLPIINGRASPAGLPPLPDLDLYFRDCVIGGKGAFLVVAKGFDDFARAVRRKLVLEIAGIPSSKSQHADNAMSSQIIKPVSFGPSADCLAGERRNTNALRQMFDNLKN